jgi:hypothetical protein
MREKEERENSKSDSILNVYLKEYEAIRNEINLRLKEKDTIVRYTVLLVSAIVVGLWKAPDNFNQTFLMLALLLIIPFISILLTFVHNWHDEMIIVLGSYIEKEIRPRINILLEKEDLLKWDTFLQEFRNKNEWKINSLVKRLIFIAPIPISMIGYFLITARLNEKWIEIIMVTMDLLLLLWIFYHFFKINKKYEKLKE